MYSSDYEEFSKLIQELGLAFNRPVIDDLVRVFWDSLKDSSYPGIKALAEKWKRVGKKFPAPSDLRPERSKAPPPAPTPEPYMSTWAIAANKILFSVAYQGDRGMKPMGEILPKCLAVKADIVQRAEQDASAGQPWDTHEFNVMCHQAFERLLADRAKADAETAAKRIAA